MNNSVIVAYGRSAIGKAKNGAFTGVHPIDWTAETLNKVLEQVPELKKEDIDDIILGSARHENKCSKNMARLVALRAGLPYSVSAQTINRFCSSGIQAIATASNAIMANNADVIVAGGVEQMSMTLTRGVDDDNEWLIENESGAYMAMGTTAENVAQKWGVTREEMDEFALNSHLKAAKAQESGLLNRSIVPIESNGKIVTLDEGIRANTTLEKLASLKPCFQEDGTVTAATSSQVSDGAAFAVLMNEKKAQELNIKPIAKIVSFVSTGCDPKYMGEGPIYAVPKVLEKANLTIDQMDVIEINEAFAAQAIPCIKELNLPIEKVNPWGGAIALGHPMGATGCVLMCKAIDYLKENNGKYALITMCIGGGMGAAAIVELI